MKKSIEFLAKIDTAEFDQAIEKLQRKIRDAARPAMNVQNQQQTADRLGAAGLGGTMSKPALEAYQRSVQTARREMDQIISKEAAGQEKLTKFIVKREEKLKSLIDLQKNLTKEQQEELKIKEKIARVEENLGKQRELQSVKNKGINQALDARASMSPKGIAGVVDAYKSGGLNGAISSLGGMGTVAGIGGAIIGAVGAVGSVANNLGGANVRLQNYIGSATQNTVGTDLKQVASGRSPFESAWMKERSKASGLAEDKEFWSRFYDRTKAIAGIGAGALTGGVAGAVMGAPIFGWGAIPGAIGGAVLGGLGAYGMSDDSTRYSITDQEKYNKTTAARRSETFRNTLEDLKNQDPIKKQIMEDFEQNLYRDVGAQRALGLNNASFRGAGGFLATQAQAGFGADQAIGMANSILGAGGSSRMAQSALGSQMERMGYTNAGGILGSLSGGIQDTGAGKQAAITAISEAFRVGLNNSEFSEENRKFTQAAAGIIARTGATGEDDQNRIVQSLGMFLGEKTNMGVQSAQGAYERSQERGSQLGGRRGALRLMDALQDPDLKKIPMDELTEMLGMNPEDLNETSDIAQYGASKAGVSVKDFLGKVQRGRENSRYLISGKKEKVQGLDKTIQGFMDENNLNYSDLDQMQKDGSLPPEVRDALAQKKLIQSSEEAAKLNPRNAAAAAGEGLTNRGVSASKSDISGQLLNGPGGRIEDDFMKQAARSADLVREQFMLLVPELQKAVAATKGFAEGTVGNAAAASAAAAGNLKGLPSGDPMNNKILRDLGISAVLAPNVTRPSK